MIKIKRMFAWGMLIAFAAVMFQTHVMKAVAQPYEIEGEYSATGTNPDGSPYIGVVIIRKDGDMYRFHWKVGTEYYGHGTLKDNILTVFWGAPDPVIYTVKDGGKTLDGVWAGGLGRETLRR
ncbi:MAG TPA: fibronectin-binding protein [Spirochaetota bacterium]|nr:fibronectin-binding protein [Spirochaetota bacterium]HPV99022.1 fibronectin-binding protein [Spirochaetota bacterium]